MRKLETARMNLSMMDKADIDAFCAYMAIPQYNQNLLLSLPVFQSSMQDIAAEYIRKGHTYMLRAKGAAQALGHIHMGEPLLTRVPAAELNNAWGVTLSFAVAPACRSNGLMTEALTAVLDELERIGVQYTHCVIRCEDARSAYLLEKLGFSCCGAYQDRSITPPCIALDYIRYLAPARFALTPPEQKPHNVSFATSGMFGVAACMLRALGHAVTDAQLALSMELPWLFACEDGVFRAGTALCSPKWMDLALLPLGYRLCQTSVPAADVLPTLDTSSAPIALPIKLHRMPKRICIYKGKEKRRYRFENLVSATSKEPMELSLTPGDISKGLDETVTLYTLQPCAPQAVDMTPYLADSLHTLEAYRMYLADLWEHPIPRAGKENAIRRHFGALITYTAPLQLMLEEYPLYVLLTLLHGELDSLILGALIRLDFRDLIDFECIDAIFDQLHESILDRLAEMDYPDDDLTRLIDDCPAVHPKIHPNDDAQKQYAFIRYLGNYQREHKLFPNVPDMKIFRS